MPPPTILPKCPPPRKVGPYRVFYSFTLIMDFFFLKTQLKSEKKNAPNVPSPTALFSSKVNFTIAYRTFFDSKK